MAYGAAPTDEPEGSLNGGGETEIDFSGVAADTPLLEKQPSKPPPGSLEEEAGTGKKHATWGRLFSLAKPEWPLLAVGTGAWLLATFG